MGLFRVLPVLRRAGTVDQIGRTYGDEALGRGLLAVSHETGAAPMTPTIIRYNPAKVLAFAQAMLHAVGRAEAWPAQADPDEPGGILLGEAACVTTNEDLAGWWTVLLASYDPGSWNGRTGAPPSIEWDRAETYETPWEAIREAILCLLRREMEDAAHALEVEEWEQQEAEHFERWRVGQR